MQQAFLYIILCVFTATAAVTLLGVSGRLKIQRQHLRALFASLLLELVALVIFLLSATNIFGLSTEDFINTLPQEIRAETTEEVAVKIRTELERLSEIPLLEEQVSAMKNDIDQKQILIEELKRKAAQLNELENHFLVKMARLHAEIENYGTSVNILWNPGEEKRAICRSIQEALREIGSFQGPLDGNPKRTHEALVRYQRIKGFQTTGYFSAPTMVVMIKDYLESR